MPFTPYHFGTGILVSAVSRNRSDWAAFALANVMVDLEPLALALRRDPPYHRFMHTFVMATAAVMAAFVLMLLAVRVWRALFKGGSPPFASARGPLLIGAALGGYSHVLLDAFLYFETQPFWPFSSANPFLNVFTGAQIRGICMVSLLLGLVIWLGVALVQRALVQEL